MGKGMGPKGARLPRAGLAALGQAHKGGRRSPRGWPPPAMVGPTPGAQLGGGVDPSPLPPINSGAPRMFSTHNSLVEIPLAL